MKKGIAIVTILLAVVLAAGCIDSGPKTYSGNGVSFQYPSDWSTNYKSDFQEGLGSSGDALVSLGKDDAGVAVAKMNLGSVQVTAADIASALKTTTQSSGFTFISESTRTVDGVKAYESTFKQTSSGLYASFTFLEKNGGLYAIIVATPSNDKQTVDLILNSFKVL